MGFLDNYEGNKDRRTRWLKTYPTGRLHAHVLDFNAEKGYILVECKGWRNDTDIEPADIDITYGFLEAYKPHMRRWFVEDTVTSAKMRVMANLLGETENATQETFKHDASFVEEPDPWSRPFSEDGFTTAHEAMAEIGSQLGGKLIAEAPLCDHGHMVLKEGISPKTGKEYKGYICTSNTKAAQCPAVWMNKSQDGTWKLQNNG
jgi:hypothetical protein